MLNIECFNMSLKVFKLVVILISWAIEFHNNDPAKRIDV